MLSANFTSLYAAFDIFPSSKGAATHIHHFLQAHQEYFAPNDTWLHCLADENFPLWQKEEGVTITRFAATIPNFLVRTGEYAYHFTQLLSHYEVQSLYHFRDVWSGLPILQQKYPKASLFEVNALMSVELPYRYNLSINTLKKIQQLEKICLTESQTIVVPSLTLKNYLVHHGVATSKIIIIPNGAIVPPIYSRPTYAPTRYIMYFGALQTWQGIENLLKAFVQLQDIEDLFLVVACAVKEKMAKRLQLFAEKLSIQHKILWLYQLDKIQLQAWIQHALVTVAPLTMCDRNLEQGCCPLKIIESMACGVPVVATAMPVTQELIRHQEDGYLVRADRPIELARGLRILIEEEVWRKEMGQNAKAKIMECFTWDIQKNKLKDLFGKTA